MPATARRSHSHTNLRTRILLRMYSRLDWSVLILTHSPLRLLNVRVSQEQSRRCPLCSQRITDYLIHHIRSKFDYQKQYLAPLRTSPAPLQARARNNARREGGGGRRNGERRERVWGRSARRGADRDEADELGRAVARRRWVYDHGLYAKVRSTTATSTNRPGIWNSFLFQHVASNSFTRYRPNPTPAQFSSSPDLITRMTIFLRRELMVWPNLDVEVRLPPSSIH